MTTRRQFFGAGVGAFCCACGLGRARAETPSGLRAPVMLGGRRVKTIDVHAHCNFREVIPLLDGDTSALIFPVPVRGAADHFLGIEQRLAAMDAMAIDMEVLNVHPFWYSKPADVARRICDLQNHKLAEICATHPERFAAFGCLTLQAPEIAVQELDYIVRRLGLKGAAIGGNVAGREFADPKFDPVWAKAEALGAALFIHPSPMPQTRATRLDGNGWLGNTIGSPLETTIALSHLIFQGTLDKFPHLKIICAHGGGFLPFYADRSDNACTVGPAFCDPAIKLRKHPSEYLRQVYFDSLVFTPRAIEYLVDTVGVDQVMIGTDTPYPWSTNPVDQVLATKLTLAQKTAILGRNATRVLGLAV